MMSAVARSHPTLRGGTGARFALAHRRAAAVRLGRVADGARRRRSRPLGRPPPGDRAITRAGASARPSWPCRSRCSSSRPSLGERPGLGTLMNALIVGVGVRRLRPPQSRAAPGRRRRRRGARRRGHRRDRPRQRALHRRQLRRRPARQPDARDRPPRAAHLGRELGDPVGALSLGFALGGPVGIGTVLFALGLGPCIEGAYWPARTLRA